MNLKPFQEKIIEQMITQEKLLSRLYALFAEQFSPHQDFWQKLSQEEQSHAKLMEKLLEAARKGIVFFDEGKVTTTTLSVFITRLEGIVQKAERGEFTLSSAFAYGVDYETSLIEKNVFSRFDSSHEKAKAALKILQSETINHVERIRDQQKMLKSQ